MAALMEVDAEGIDPLDLARSEEDRRLLAAILMHDEEELTPDAVEGAVRALRRIHLERQQGEVQRAVERPGLSMEEKKALAQEKVRLKLAKMNPSGTGTDG